MAQPDEDEKVLVPNGPGGKTWSLAGLVSSDDNDAGLVPEQAMAIDGHVWNDQNKNGLQDAEEALLPGMKIRLERQVVSEDLDALQWLGWTLTDGAFGSNLDNDGEPLEKAERVDPNAPIVKPEEPSDPVDPEDPEDPDNPDNPDNPTEPEDPDNPGDPTDPEDPDNPGEGEGEGEDGDDTTGDDTTGDITGGDEADPADPSAHADGDAEVTEPTDPTEPSEPTEPTDPSTPEEPTEPIDPNEPSEPETPEEPPAPLERLEDDGILHTGDWVEVASTTSGLLGDYSFTGLPLADDEGHAYRYRIRMDKPDGTYYVPVSVGSDDNLDNDWAHLNVLGEITPEQYGVTHAMDACLVRGKEPNAYGQVFSISAPQNWTREMGRAVDLGLAYPDPDEPDPEIPPIDEPEQPTPNEPTPPVIDEPTPDAPPQLLLKMLPKTGDPLWTLKLMLGLVALVAGAVALIAYRRKKRREEAEAECM